MRHPETHGQETNKQQPSDIVISLGHYKEDEQKALLRRCLELKDLYLRSDGEAQQF